MSFDGMWPAFVFFIRRHPMQRSAATKPPPPPPPPPPTPLHHRTQLALSGVPPKHLFFTGTMKRQHDGPSPHHFWRITMLSRVKLAARPQTKAHFHTGQTVGVWQPTPKGVVTTKGANVFEPYRSAGRSAEMIQFVPGRSQCRRGCSAAIWLCFRPLSHYVPRQSPEKQVKAVRTELKYL